MKILLPAPFEDEHIFSVFARFHKTSANLTVPESMRQLSIHKGAFRSQNIFNKPFHSALHAASKSLDINQCDVATHHSLYPFYKLSLPNKFLADWLRDWRNERFSSTCEHEWMNDRALIFDKSWRYCDECIDEDRKLFGIQYWHVQHQIPTIKHCHIHKTLLRGVCSTCHQNISTLNDFMLPSHKCLCKLVASNINLKWETDVINQFKTLKNDSSTCLEKTKQRICDKWGLSMHNLGKQKSLMNEILLALEDHYGMPFLSEIFEYYRDGSIYRGRSRPDIVKNSLMQQSFNIRHPTFYLLLMKLGAGYNQNIRVAEIQHHD